MVIPHFFYWRLTAKQPKMVQLLTDNSRATELVFVLTADDAEPNPDAMPPAAGWCLALGHGRSPCPRVTLGRGRLPSFPH